jgi:hypothetical protein
MITIKYDRRFIKLEFNNEDIDKTIKKIDKRIWR